jgi:hypothetical protein
MKRQLLGVLQLLALFAVMIALIRFFPIVVRIGNAAALGIREFWWIVLIFSLGGWLIWFLRKRNSG